MTCFIRYLCKQSSGLQFPSWLPWSTEKSTFYFIKAALGILVDPLAMFSLFWHLRDWILFVLWSQKIINPPAPNSWIRSGPCPQGMYGLVVEKKHSYYRCRGRRWCRVGRTNVRAVRKFCWLVGGETRGQRSIGKRTLGLGSEELGFRNLRSVYISCGPWFLWAWVASSK